MFAGSSLFQKPKLQPHLLSGSMIATKWTGSLKSTPVRPKLIKPTRSII